MCVCACVCMDVILCGWVYVYVFGVDFVSVDLDSVLLIGRFFFCFAFCCFVVVGWQLIFSLNIFFFSFFFFYLTKHFRWFLRERSRRSPLVPSTLLVAFTSQMSALAAAVASLWSLRAVLGDVSGAVALIAWNVCWPVAALIHSIGAVAHPMSGLVAPVARRIVGLSAVLGDVANAVAPIAALRLFGARACKVPKLIAFVALFTITTHAAATAITHATATTGSAASWSSAETAVPGKVARPVALVARGRHRHCTVLELIRESVQNCFNHTFRIVRQSHTSWATAASTSKTDLR